MHNIHKDAGKEVSCRLQRSFDLFHAASGVVIGTRYSSASLSSRDDEKAASERTASGSDGALLPRRAEKPFSSSDFLPHDGQSFFFLLLFFVPEQCKARRTAHKSSVSFI